MIRTHNCPNKGAVILSEGMREEQPQETKPGHDTTKKS